jgi:hypothetical protein
MCNCDQISSLINSGKLDILYSGWSKQIIGLTSRHSTKHRFFPLLVPSTSLRVVSVCVCVFCVHVIHRWGSVLWVRWFSYNSSIEDINS